MVGWIKQKFNPLVVTVQLVQFFRTSVTRSVIHHGDPGMRCALQQGINTLLQHLARIIVNDDGSYGHLCFSSWPANVATRNSGQGQLDRVDFLNLPALFLTRL